MLITVNEVNDCVILTKQYVIGIFIIYICGNCFSFYGSVPNKEM